MAKNHQTIQALLFTGGHVFDHEPFFAMVEAIRGGDGPSIDWTHVEQPAALDALRPERLERFDVVVFYDMPGVTFTRSSPPFAHFDPSDQFKSDFLSMVERGKGLVFLHHAISSWPSWPKFAEVLGGRFHFLPGELDGKAFPGSGYRFLTEQRVSVVDPTHPITQGLDAEFPLTDEVYLFPVMEDQVSPLLRSDFEFKAENFKRGGVSFREHPEGSSLLGWTRHVGNSDIVYLQPGHGPSAFGDPSYRKLLRNAVLWASEAHHEREATE